MFMFLQPPQVWSSTIHEIQLHPACFCFVHHGYGHCYSSYVVLVSLILIGTGLGSIVGQENMSDYLYLFGKMLASSKRCHAEP